MSMSNAAETAFLDLLFRNANWSNVGDATGLRGATAAGSFYFALHTADPGEAGDQSTNEAAYTGYARVAVVRSGVGFSLAGNTVANAALLQFPQCTGGSATCTHFSIGVASSGAGQIVLSGALNASLAVSNLIQPQFDPGALTASAD